MAAIAAGVLVHQAIDAGVTWMDELTDADAERLEDAMRDVADSMIDRGCRVDVPRGLVSLRDIAEAAGVTPRWLEGER